MQYILGNRKKVNYSIFLTHILHMCTHLHQVSHPQDSKPADGQIATLSPVILKHDF